MMDRHCVNKMSVIVLLQPMDCQRALYVHGRAAGIKSDESSRRLSTTLNFTLLNKGRSKMKGERKTTGGERKSHRRLFWTHNRALS